jgi:transposase
VADPDEVIDHVPGSCRGCGGALAGADAAGVIVRQVRDVPLVRVRVVEHRLHKRVCGAVTAAPAPAGVDAPVCYEPNLRAVAVYLVVFQHVPVKRAALLIADLTGAPVSTGWVSEQVARTGEALVQVEALIKTLITLAAVIGVDETSLNVAGDRKWLHVARTERLTAYHLHESRGRVAVAEFGVLPGYSGTAVRDALAVYDSYPATHALCGAHLIRELTDVAETHPDAQWPTQARDTLVELNRLAAAARAAGLTAISPEQAAEPLRLFGHAVRVGLAEHPRRNGRKQSKARNLLERLRDREAEILRTPAIWSCRSPTTAANATCGRSRPSSRSLAVTAPPPAPPPGSASADTSPPSANTATTSSPHYATRSPEHPGAHHNPRRPEWLPFTREQIQPST